MKQLNKGYSGFNRSCSGFFIAGTFKSKSNVLFTQTVISGKAYDHMSSGWKIAMVVFGLIIYKCVAQNNIVVSVLKPEKSGEKRAVQPTISVGPQTLQRQGKC